MAQEDSGRPQALVRPRGSEQLPGSVITDYFCTDRSRLITAVLTAWTFLAGFCGWSQMSVLRQVKKGQCVFF